MNIVLKDLVTHYFKLNGRNERDFVNLVGLVHCSHEEKALAVMAYLQTTAAQNLAAIISAGADREALMNEVSQMVDEEVKKNEHLCRL